MQYMVESIGRKNLTTEEICKFENTVKMYIKILQLNVNITHKWTNCAQADRNFQRP